MATLLKLSRCITSPSMRKIAQRSAKKSFGFQIQRSFSISRCVYTERKYSEQHEWVTVDGNTGTIGISDYAQDKLGDIAYVQLPDVGAEFDIDEECGALESVKAASEIFSPLSGKVVEVNSGLESKPALINQSCYEQGWLFKLELSKPDEMSNLMDEGAYEKFLASQDED